MDEGAFEQLKAALGPSEPGSAVGWPGEIAIAMLRVLARRDGPGFVEEVRSEIAAKSERLVAAGSEEDLRDAAGLRGLLDEAIWEGLTGAPAADGKPPSLRTAGWNALEDCPRRDPSSSPEGDPPPR